MKSIKFNTEEVKAVLEGNKTQFRLPLKVQPTNSKQEFATTVSSTCKKRNGQHHFINPENTSDRTDWFKHPYEAGDEIFVKESWNILCEQVVYEANSEKASKFFWMPASRMKQEQSRLTLRIKNIRVERLEEISEEDAANEAGVFKSEDYWHSTLHPIKGTYQCWATAKQAFGKLWNKNHPKHLFESNPWVWVVEFELLTIN